MSRASSSSPRRPSSRRRVEDLNKEAFRYYQRLGRLDKFVSRRYHEPISLARAAAVAGLERTYFCRFFHAKTGMHFRDWLSYRRIREAEDLLGRRNFSITEVSSRVGFNDVRTFERAFRRFTGSTPRDYKKSVRPT